MSPQSQCDGRHWLPSLPAGGGCCHPDLSAASHPPLTRTDCTLQGGPRHRLPGRSEASLAQHRRHPAGDRQLPQTAECGEEFRAERGAESGAGAAQVSLKAGCCSQARNTSSLIVKNCVTMIPLQVTIISYHFIISSSTICAKLWCSSALNSMVGLKCYEMFK